MERVNRSKITRNREFRSCTECRRRKLKCDRQLPCALCLRRNDAESCTYAEKSSIQPSEQRNQAQAEARLQHLEQLVEHLSRSQGLSDRTAPSIDPLSAPRSSNGVTDPPFLNGATHWTSMLDDIRDIRIVISQREDSNQIDENFSDEEEPDDATSLLFGAGRPLLFDEILSNHLPDKRAVDRLVGAYFRMKTVAAPFIHTGQFRRLYQLFWEDPSSSPPLWTSLLFSILDIAEKIVPNMPDNPYVEKHNRFDLAAAHCLVVGKYHRPQKFAVEALLLFIQAKCLAGINLDPDVPILFGTLARLGTIIGYHREPDRSGQRLSAFEAEMRRRTWSTFMQLDILISFQLGLPSNTQFPTWDTRPPTNILDSDFDEDTQSLPAEAPFDEPTQLSLYIQKHKLLSVFEKVLRHTLSTVETPYGELQMIDQEIKRTFRSLPATFQPRPLEESIVDPPSFVITRICVNSIYLKSLCVLHRKEMLQGGDESFKICYDSASDLVGQFIEMQNETELGGQLETERWFVSSIAWHDFLLGCVTLCLCVCRIENSFADSGTTGMIEKVHLLERAAAACEKQSNKNKETGQVRRLLEATAKKIRSKEGQDLNWRPNVSSKTYDQASNTQWPTEFITQGNENHWLSQSLAGENGRPYLAQYLDLPMDESMPEPFW